MAYWFCSSTNTVCNHVVVYICLKIVPEAGSRFINYVRHFTFSFLILMILGSWLIWTPKFVDSVLVYI